jgi:MoxR-like ATPase
MSFQAPITIKAALDRMHRHDYVLPDDVKAIGPDVLRHRILTTYEAEAEEVTADDLVRLIFEAVEVP